MRGDRWISLILVVVFLALALPTAFAEDNASDEYVDVIVNLKERSAPKLKALEARRAPGFGAMGRFRQQLHNIRKQGIRQAQKEFLDSIDIPDRKVKHVYSNVNSVVMRIKRSEIHKLRSDPNVESFGEGVRFDSFLTNSVPLIGGDTVHRTQHNGVNITGAGEVICVVDTGIDYTHSEFGSCTQGQMTSGTCPKIPGGYDYVNNDNDPADDRGHGTHVAGIAAAASSVKGVAPGAKLLAMKSLNANGSDPTGAWVLAGIDYCVNNSATYNISVITLSLGTYEFNNTVCDNDNRAMMAAIKKAIDSAHGLGIIVTASSGNYFSTVSPTYGVAFPACLTNTTAIGSTNNVGYSPVDGISSFTQRGNTLDLLAPGRMINSAVPPMSACTGVGPLCDDTGYKLLQGTSQAAPHTAGAAALLQHYSKLRNSQSLTPLEIETILKRTGKPISDTGYTGSSFPRINLTAAVDSILLISQANDTVGNSHATVDFASDTDFTDAQYCFNISPASVSMDSSDSSCSAFNNSAQITVYSLPYNSMPLVYIDGALCTQCSGTSYSSGTFIFSVPGFSTYTFGVNAQLQAYDQGDPPAGSLATDEDAAIAFYANYTNLSSGSAVSGANCTVIFDDNQSLPLLFDASSGLYNSTRIFSNNRTYSYNTTCTAQNAETLSASGNVAIAGINNHPAVNITSPADSSSHYNRSVITFRATATDDEDGPLPGPAWWSDVDGYLGSGGELNISNLSVSNHTILANATDSTNLTGNSSITIEVTPRDDDNDGLYDDVDTLMGNSSSLNLTGISTATVKISGSPAIDGIAFSGRQHVEIWNNLNLLINFSYNFSQGTLNLSRIMIDVNASSGLAVDLDNQQQQEKKTLFVSDPGYTSLCIKDAPVLSVNQITSSCTGASEFDFTSCISNSTGVTISGITCYDLGNNFRIENLNHSGVRGSTSGGGGSGSSGYSGYSGGGGGGGGGSYARSLSTRPSSIKISTLCADMDNTVSVYNALGSPMGFIDLRIFDSSGSQLYKGKTSRNGNIAFRFPAEGKYTIEAKYENTLTNTIKMVNCSTSSSGASSPGSSDAQDREGDDEEVDGEDPAGDGEGKDGPENHDLDDDGKDNGKGQRKVQDVEEADFFLFGSLLLLAAVGIIVPLALLNRYRPEMFDAQKILPQRFLNKKPAKKKSAPAKRKRLGKKKKTSRRKKKHDKKKARLLKRLDRSLHKINKKIKKHE